MKIPKIPMVGRIQNAKVINGNVQTILATPAPDPYSQPQTYLLRSKAQLGQVGQEIHVLADLRGFVRLKNFVNKQTGMQDEFWEGNIFLDAELAPAKAAG